jgi:hypothetical protein
MRARRVLAVLAVAALVAPACSPDQGSIRPRPRPAPDGRPAVAGGTPRSERIANYRIKAALDDVKHVITATQTLSWTNPGPTEVHALPFHLYLNAFKNESSVFMRESRGHHRSARAAADGWGWIDITSIQIAGAELRPTARYLPPADAPDDQTVLELPLPAPLAAGATINVDFAFTAQLPEVFARTGHKGAFTMVGQWFPKIGVRAGVTGRWVCEPFHLNGEFFADFGTYDVALTVPQTHVVAATGVLTEAADHPDGTRTLTYRAEDVHDFAWMTDPYMDVVRGVAKVDGREVEVRVYHRPPQREFAQRHLGAAIGTIEHMSAMFVPYPWPIMSVIDPPLDAVDGAGGMEYPTLVTTSGDSVFSRPGIRLPEYVTVHEVGHNWFQGILASNEAEEAWLDEGVNEWADAVTMARIYGDRGGGFEWLGYSAEMFRLRRALGDDLGKLPSPVASAAWAFADSASYSDASYDKTMLALRTLENLVGRDRFAAAMQSYAQQWAFKHPTGRDLFESLRASLGEDLGWFIGPAFQGIGTVEFGVRSAECQPAHPPRGVVGDGSGRKLVTSAEAPDTGGFQCEVIVVNTGTVAVPVDVELRLADGSSVRKRWDDRTGEHWQRFELAGSSPIVEVVIDPDHQVLLGDNLLEWETRLQPDSRAAWRAAARVGFWGQTTMSVLGL